MHRKINSRWFESRCEFRSTLLLGLIKRNCLRFRDLKLALLCLFDRTIPSAKLSRQQQDTVPQGHCGGTLRPKSKVVVIGQLLSKAVTLRTRGTELRWVGPFPTQKNCVPKGPFRTKNTTTMAKVVNYYAVVFLLRPPDLLRRRPFAEREDVCNSQANSVCTRCAAIVNHRAIVEILRVVNLLRIVFLVRQGPLGTPSPGLF